MGLKESHILSSVFSYITDNHDVPVKWEKPEKFDAVAEGLSSFYHLEVRSFQLVSQRKSHPDHKRVVITAHCWARTQSNFLASLRVAEDLADLLSRQEIPLYDYSDSSEPQTGLLRLEEPQIDRQTSETSQWQHHMVTVEGVAQAFQ